MSGTGSASSGSTGSGSSGGQSPGTQSPAGQAPGDGHRAEENQGWSIFSYLISGMVVYGLVGWLVASLTHIPVLLPLGALLGLVFAIGGVVWKYGRNQ